MAIDTTTAEEKLALAKEIGMDPIFIPLMEIALLPVKAGPFATLKDWRKQMERWVHGDAQKEYREALVNLHQLKASGLYEETMKLLKQNATQAVHTH